VDYVVDRVFADVVQELGAPSKKLAEETGASDKLDHALDESLDDVK